MLLRLPVASPTLVLDDPETWTDVHVCDSTTHAREPVYASRRAHWPTGPIEYCEPCYLWMREVEKALGLTVHVEPLPFLAVVEQFQRVVNRLRLPKE